MTFFLAACFNGRCRAADGWNRTVTLYISLNGRPHLNLRKCSVYWRNELDNTGMQDLFHPFGPPRIFNPACLYSHADERVPAQVPPASPFTMHMQGFSQLPAALDAASVHCAAECLLLAAICRSF